MVKGRVVPFPQRREREPTSDELAALARKHLAGGNVEWDHEHFQLRMRRRGVSIRQVLEAVKVGEVRKPPRKDEYGDWRVRFEKFVAGRTVRVVVAVKEDYAVLVTVI